VVQPSLTEGFGLPPLEALACGVAVLSSDAGSLPEVLGDCAVYLPPSDPEAWGHEVQELLSDGNLRQTLATRGRARAATFTWERTAQRTYELYEQVLGRTKTQ
jgi:glycosyltransferase involved in cell wall biosynthesis